MKVVVFLAGLLIGLVAGAGSLLYLQAQHKLPDEMEIVFASKNFYDTEAVVSVSGTLTGEGLAYPNNTNSIACFKDRKECWISAIQAIAAKQVGRMDAPYEYEIRKWSPYEIVAGDDGAFGCYKTTITIERKAQQVLWVEEPVNQTQSLCKNSETKIRKYTIESSPGWKRAFGKDS